MKSKLTLMTGGAGFIGSEERVGQRPEVLLEEWRTGDQRHSVLDTRKFQAATGWAGASEPRRFVALQDPVESYVG